MRLHHFLYCNPLPQILPLRRNKKVFSLQKLEEKKLIVRAQDQTDRRKQIITITSAGAAVITANLDTSVALLEQVRDRMGGDRYDELLDLLNELHATELEPGKE